jgi:AGZA family xanthine/uracil permease-like MFS transporter
LLDENGNIPNLNKAMLADAIATTAGAILGTSTVTTFVESSAGTAVGGKTSLTAYVVAILFALAMFLSPIAQLIPSCATATALIYVGVLMMNNVRDIDWSDPAVSVPAFLTIAMMPFTYNISFGIGFGLIAHVLIKVCTGKAKEISVATYVLTAIFLAMFLFTH